MSKNEMELIELIRSSDNPELALLEATKIILCFLEQHESSAAPSAGYLPAHA